VHSGLRVLALENGIDTPAVFTDPAFTESTTFRLSTSNMSPQLHYDAGFGPVSTDGYGCCYGIRKMNITCSVTALRDCEKTSATKMRDAIAHALRDMRRLYEPAARL